MTEREKLIKLLHDGNKHCRMITCNECEYFTTLAYCKDNIVADHLLANGVTFATDTNVGSKWISVRDRLPKEPMEYIVVIKGGANATTLLFDGALWFEEDPEGWRTYYAVTHWMPLPEPPKGDGC